MNANRPFLPLCGLLLLCSTATSAYSAPKLSISPLGYQITQLQGVPGSPRAFDVTSRVGVANSGDPAIEVTAQLASDVQAVIVLDGQVGFGNVPRTRPLRPVSSQDTFKLRIIVPSFMRFAEVLDFIREVQAGLSWTISCGNCGAVNRPPTADAGADQTAYVQQLVTLNGTGSSDVDGDALTYEWRLVSQPAGSATSLSGATTANPTLTPDREGEYNVQLVVRDGQSASAPDAVLVSTLNSAPVANAGADQTAFVGQTVQLDGAGSGDIDGDALTYAWQVARRPAGSMSQLDRPDEVNPTLTPDLPGEYVIDLVVDDGSVSSTPDAMVISTLDSRPVSNAGPDQTVHVGDTARLDGSGSHDADGDPLTYRWSLSTRPANSAAALAGETTASPTLPIDSPGTYIAQLIVNDGHMDSDADTVAVSTVNSPPVAKAGANQMVHFGTTVHLNGSASGDADGDGLTFTWALLSVPQNSAAALSDTVAIAPSFVADRPGTYVVQLVVNDGTANSTPSSLTVTSQNEAPTARDDTAMTQSGSAVTIDVLANDSDGDLQDTLRIESVTQPENGTVTFTASAVTYTPNGGFGGTDSFTYRITDGADVATATVAVTIEAANGAPLANAGSDQRAYVGDTVLLDGSASSDPENQRLSYRWSTVDQPAGGNASIVPLDGGRAALTVAAEGDYVLQLIVNDGTLDSTPDRVSVRFDRPNSPPVAVDDAASTQAGVGVSIAVLANDSDPDGDPLQIESVSLPTSGAVSVSGDVLSFVPGSGFVGTSSFTYTVHDGREGRATAAVIVTVVAIPPPPPIARIAISPEAVLLTSPDMSQSLEVQAFDAAGVPLGPVPPQDLEISSSDPESIAFTSRGLVAQRPVGSALIRANLRSAPSIAAPPILAVAAVLSTAEEVSVLADREVLDEPVASSDSTYVVTLERDIPVGGLVVGVGGRPVMGRVIASADTGDGIAFRTEIALVPLTEIFAELRVAYSFSESELAALAVPVPDQPAGASALVSRSLRPGKNTAVAPHALPSADKEGPCKVDAGVAPETNVRMHGRVDPQIRFDFEHEIADGEVKVFRMVAYGSLHPSATLLADLRADVSATFSCSIDLFEIPLPISGFLAAIVRPVIPVSLKAAVELQAQVIDAHATLTAGGRVDFANGIDYTSAAGFLPVDFATFIADPLQPTFTYAPHESLRFRINGFAGPVGKIALRALSTTFDAVALSAGPAFEVKLGFPYDVSTDDEYLASYALRVIAKAGPGKDIQALIARIFGSPRTVIPEVKLDFELARSPAAGGELTADRLEFEGGDTVNFHITLDPASTLFPGILTPAPSYNVQEVRIYLRDDDAGTATQIGSVAGAEGQTTFDFAWTADRAGRATNPSTGRPSFYAFVVPLFLSTVTSALPLELGPIVARVPLEIVPKIVNLRRGEQRQFTARVDGVESTDVVWSATGGTISSAGLYQAGQFDGPFHVTVARVDRPEITDEARVEIRPTCIPGTSAAYCGFRYSQVFATNSYRTVGVNDNGEWVGLLYDSANWRDSRNPPLWVVGRGSTRQTVAGLTGRFPVTPRVGFFDRGYIELTNTNAFAGAVVGSDSGRSSLGTEAFVVHNGIATFLPPLTPGAYAVAVDVSDDLVVVGYEEFMSGTSLTRRALRWVNGVPQDLGPGEAQGTSADGRVVILDHGILRVWHDGIEAILPASNGCYPFDINSTGEVLAGCPEGSVIFRNGTLETLPGPGVAFAFNDRGEVLGYTNEPPEGPTGVLWSNGQRKLVSLMEGFYTGEYGSPTSLSRTKGLLGGSGENCNAVLVAVGVPCPPDPQLVQYVWIAYPVTEVLPPP